MSKELLAGVERFRTEVYPEHAERFAELVNGQSPNTLFIVCADSRIDPSLITQTEPGEIFVVRNAGNIIAPFDPDGALDDGTAASIEYAVTALKVKDVVVCGHSGCGAMAALFDPTSLAALPEMTQWVSHAGVDPEGLSLDEVVAQNVLQQIEHLRDYPSVRDRDDINLHGWVYNLSLIHI